jgi:hypothetical protein
MASAGAVAEIAVAVPLAVLFLGPEGAAIGAAGRAPRMLDASPEYVQSSAEVPGQGPWIRSPVEGDALSRDPNDAG